MDHAQHLCTGACLLAMDHAQHLCTGACLLAMDHAQHLCTGVLACMLWTMPSISALGCLLACYGPCPASLHWCLLACYGPCPASLRWCLLASINCPMPCMHSEGSSDCSWTRIDSAKKQHSLSKVHFNTGRLLEFNGLQYHFAAGQVFVAFANPASVPFG